ncbi:bifunctional adenosylcobinamide kinase/adenosylcobinamide-phosphate guanylyltransferase [Pseudorhodoferax sp. Leaf267]|uniref:bifunctional adenosylcobinamide kinase/adenosylcobinamide-phosphate guanylyltransferase n=1 Tax=Pseudorhodoferax sp. Leaf267 TaxID=1736316 RepID=UPI0006FF7C95|nr:bifunctional adenosylcobinamide kinase/adenosylcobinamide-phosphate guanylyltransferase [Pseudorhodoferax sp. Leaf267]KQP22851.1 adenosylcobinamide-phosphate guanylyltransferase [Pseudorhodoferax sp. Leaf267]
MAELILGGQKSGKSRRAELLARDWLAGDPARDAVLIATGQPYDDEMRARIARHRLDRARRVPGLRTVEEPLQLAAAIAAHSAPGTLVVVDCLTLWLTNWLMPMSAAPRAGDPAAAIDALEAAVRSTRGPVLLVGNEIGLGVIPLGREVRQFVDALGGLNQRMAAACSRVTLMAAGLPLVLKDSG